ncbi:MAG: response regulator [Verrucomicrobiota bacterium]|nr:response regulator [Verrucomicrobiota bacterium]
MRALSIRHKLLWITLASTATALVLVAAAILTYEFFASRHAVREDVSALAQIIGDQSTAALTFDDKGTAEENLQAFSRQGHITAAAIYKGNELFARYPDGLTNTAVLPARPGWAGARFEGNALVLFQPIKLEKETIGTVYLRSDLGGVRARLWQDAWILGLFSAAALAAAWLLASRLQRVISRPISHLAQTAAIVSAGQNYSIRARKESADELGRLIDGFNEMLGKIQERDAALQRAKEELERRVEERTRDLRQQFDRISLLNRITYAVAARQDLDSIFRIVLEELEERLPLDYGSAYAFDAPADAFRLLRRGAKGGALAEALHIPETVPVEQSIFRPCLQGAMVYEPDVSRLETPMAKKVAEAGLLSSLGAPLMVEGEMFGLLALLRRGRDAFTAPERDFIRGLSAHVAMAVHQAQLYQGLQKAYNNLRQTQHVIMRQERLKALGQMASGIAHDINNTLSPIVGFAELIERGEPGLSPEARRHLRRIKTAGEDIAQIVSRLREFYRPRDRHELHAPVNLNQIAAQVVELTRPRWRDIPQSRGVMVEMRLDLDTQLPELAGSETEVREALTNLILNAVDALPDGGEITLRTRELNSDLPEAKRGLLGHALLEVADTGVGMDAETRKHCLEPFFSTKGARGTGLGLAMVYGVMERHGGRIDIASEPGRGTRVQLIFPVRAVAPSSGAAPGADEKIGPLRLLCIDDEPLLRELLMDMLASDGHRVELTGGGQAGLDAFRAARRRGEPFHAVLTDLGMPYLDGHAVAKILKRESPETPVIMLTGWGDFLKQDGALPGHIDGILSKPPHIREIRDMLRRLVLNG